MRAIDATLLGTAAELARRGIFEVEPNPLVGAVVVRDGVIVGRGFHSRYGGSHAEVAALEDAGPRARGSDLYVTLEPCSTQAKTPPCVDAIAQAGISRVVFGEVDPNPVHAGRAVGILQSKGIMVDGPLPGAVDGLLDRFRRHLLRCRPFVIAKWAMSLDGKIASKTGGSQWISGAGARAQVHALRGHVDAIAVGRGTVDRDDPWLTARPSGPLVARRIVFDRTLAVRRDWRALSDGGPQVVIVHETRAPKDRMVELAERGVKLLAVEPNDARAALCSALSSLWSCGVRRLLVEGGPKLLGSFADARVIDQVRAYIAPSVVGGATAPSAVAGNGAADPKDGIGLCGVRFETIGSDIACFGFARDVAD